MRNIKLTFGETSFTKDGKLIFPPENAKTKSIKGSPMIEINLNNKEQGIDR